MDGKEMRLPGGRRSQAQRAAETDTEDEELVFLSLRRRTPSQVQAVSASLYMHERAATTLSIGLPPGDAPQSSSAATEEAVEGSAQRPSLLRRVLCGCYPPLGVSAEQEAPSASVDFHRLFLSIRHVDADALVASCHPNVALVLGDVHAYADDLKSQLELQFSYGAHAGSGMQWTVYRRVRDFVRLHSLLTWRHVQRQLRPPLPSFPKQALAPTSQQQPVLLEDYLRELFAAVTALSCPELCEFCELSAFSLQRSPATTGPQTDDSSAGCSRGDGSNTCACSSDRNSPSIQRDDDRRASAACNISSNGTSCKLREGYLKLKIYGMRSRWQRWLCACLPMMEPSYYVTRWVVATHEGLVIVEHPLDDPQYPRDVFLFDHRLRVELRAGGARLPGRRPCGIVLTNAQRRVQLKPASRAQAFLWARLLAPFHSPPTHPYNSFYPVHGPGRPHGGDGGSDTGRADDLYAGRSGCAGDAQPGSLVAPNPSDQLMVRFCIDACEYYDRLAAVIDGARSELCIMGWWLSPELYLRRPVGAGDNERFRLDRLLQRKAAEGVRVRVLVFKEIALSLPLDSAYTKGRLQKLHANIVVQRHPDHTLGPLYWAHHEKLVVVDRHTAFVGGIDLCYGRYDDARHALNDWYPPAVAPERTVWPGMDYSNTRVRDFRNVATQHAVSVIDRRSVPRLPWHDVAVELLGAPAVAGIVRHFCERWNFCKASKGMHRPAVPFLLPDMPCGRSDGRSGSLASSADLQPCGRSDDRSGSLADLQPCGSKGPGGIAATSADSDWHAAASVQLLRQAGSWSHGLSDTERSVLYAMKHRIERAQYFVYIENQFFVSNADPSRGANADDTADDSSSDVAPSLYIHNSLAESIVRRIVRAHSEGAPFRIVIVIPLIPAFESPGTGETVVVRMIMQAQFASLVRGPHSVYAALRRRGVAEPERYLLVTSLRTWDVLGGRHVTEQVYVHSKLLIVDDVECIIGSANINDRSLVGFRDSEIAAHIVCPAAVRRLRLRLWAEHLGILDAGASSSPADPAVMAASPSAVTDEIECQLGDVVKAYELIRDVTAKNTQIFRELFRCIPDDTVASWRDYVDNVRLREQDAVFATTGPQGTRAAQSLQESMLPNPLAMLPNPLMMLTDPLASAVANPLATLAADSAGAGTGTAATMAPAGMPDRMQLLREVRGTWVRFSLGFLREEDLLAATLAPEFLLPYEVFT